MNNLEIRKATKADLANVLEMLQQAELPTDIDLKKMHIYLHLLDQELLGISGLEQFGHAALLRSVVVEKRLQGQGWGRKITEKTIAIAKKSQVARLFLLTTTAPEFFEKLGFESIDRKDVPPAVTSSDEFVSLCPDSAICMVKMLV